MKNCSSVVSIYFFDQIANIDFSVIFVPRYSLPKLTQQIGPIVDLQSLGQDLDLELPSLKSDLDLDLAGFKSDLNLDCLV